MALARQSFSRCTMHLSNKRRAHVIECSFEKIFSKSNSGCSASWWYQSRRTGRPAIMHQMISPRLKTSKLGRTSAPASFPWPKGA